MPTKWYIDADKGCGVYTSTGMRKRADGDFDLPSGDRVSKTLVFDNPWEAHAAWASLYMSAAHAARALADEYLRRSELVGKMAYYVTDSAEPVLCDMPEDASVTSTEVEAKVSKKGTIVRAKWEFFRLRKRDAYALYLEMLREKANAKRKEAEMAKAEHDAIQAEIRELFSQGYTANTYTLSEADE